MYEYNFSIGFMGVELKNVMTGLPPTGVSKSGPRAGQAGNHGAQ
jgi:hypothetical protein